MNLLVRDRNLEGPQREEIESFGTSMVPPREGRYKSPSGCRAAAVVDDGHAARFSEGPLFASWFTAAGAIALVG